MVNATTPLQALVDARALLADPKHWTQCAIARDSRGDWREPHSSGAVCWCIDGAIQRCTDRGAMAVQDLAILAVAEAIGRRDNIWTVVDWNDDDTRSHDEVLDALDRAIARMQEAE